MSNDKNDFLQIIKNSINNSVKEYDCSNLINKNNETKKDTNHNRYNTSKDYILNINQYDNNFSNENNNYSEYHEDNSGFKFLQEISHLKPDSKLDNYNKIDSKIDNKNNKYNKRNQNNSNNNQFRKLIHNALVEYCNNHSKEILNIISKAVKNDIFHQKIINILLSNKQFKQKIEYISEEGIKESISDFISRRLYKDE